MQGPAHAEIGLRRATSFAIEKGKVLMKTAEPVRQLALYASACCNDQLLFFVNDQFTRCPKCHRLCFWKLIEGVVSWEEMDDLQLNVA